MTWEDKFYRSLKRDIATFYDENFPNNGDYKAVHLAMLANMYNYERFDTCDDIAEERAVFLTEVSEAVWG